MRIYGLLAALALFAAACGTGLSAGEVVDKRYEPEDTDIVPITSCSTDSQGHTQCHTSYITQYDDEDWLIKLRACDGEDKCKTSWVEVPENTYDRLQIGDYFDTKSGAVGTPVPTYAPSGS